MERSIRRKTVLVNTCGKRLSTLISIVALLRTQLPATRSRAAIRGAVDANARVSIFGDGRGSVVTQDVTVFAVSLPFPTGPGAGLERSRKPLHDVADC
jgi:hypothetical protein